MHPSSAFRTSKEDTLRAIVAAYPFATIAVNGEEGPVMAMAPVLMANDGRTLFGHVSKANPFWRCAQDGPVPGVALFRGPDAYVSPSWYPSKTAHGKAVPTWNYISVEARGTLTVETDADRMSAFLEPLTEKMEAGQETPWRISDAPESYIRSLSAAIVGFSLAVRSLTGVRKLSQNKSEADQAGVIAGLKRSSRADDRAIAEAMSGEETSGCS